MKTVFKVLALSAVISLGGAFAFASDTFKIMSPTGPISVKSGHDSAWREKVQNDLLEKAIPAQGRDVVVLFSGQANLAQAEGLSWLEKGRFVHQALLEAAEQSQAELIALLNAHPESY